MAEPWLPCANGRQPVNHGTPIVVQRTVQLPLAIDADKVEAVLKDGVLRIVLPKRAELKPRQISVKTT